MHARLAQGILTLLFAGPLKCLYTLEKLHANRRSVRRSEPALSEVEGMTAFRVRCSLPLKTTKGGAAVIRQYPYKPSLSHNKRMFVRHRPCSSLLDSLSPCHPEQATGLVKLLWTVEGSAVRFARPFAEVEV